MSAINHQNQLTLYRKRMQYSQTEVSRLLGHRDTSMLSRYEKGQALPTLATGLRLEIIYRVPVAFLFSDLYDTLRKEIRREEDRMAGRGQLPLL